MIRLVRLGNSAKKERRKRSRRSKIDTYSSHARLYIDWGHKQSTHSDGAWHLFSATDNTVERRARQSPVPELWVKGLFGNERRVVLSLERFRRVMRIPV